MKASDGPMRIYLAIALLFAASIIGCEKSEPKQVVHPQVSQDQEALENAKSQIQTLEEQISRLKNDNERLKAKNKFLAAQNEIMNPRLQQVIAWYGTGLWAYNENINSPVFVKSMKDANVQDVVAKLNEKFARDKQPKIIVEKNEGRTVYISVDNDEQLSERMGSHGALSYMTVATYSLISVKDVDCVFFDIEEGDHASPGKYCKENLEPLEPQ